MTFDGAGAKRQLLGYLVVGETVSHQIKEFDLPFR
jgi:hypothetical protein